MEHFCVSFLWIPQYWWMVDVVCFMDRCGKKGCESEGENLRKSGCCINKEKVVEFVLKTAEREKRYV